MKTCLILTRTTKTAGAEKIVDLIAEGVSKQNYLVTLSALHNAQNKLVYENLASIFFKKYNLIHSHLFLPGLLIRLRRIFDSHFVWIHTVHYGSYEYQAWAKTKRFLDYFIFSKADDLVAVSPSVQKWLEKNPRFKDHVILIENSYSTQEAPHQPQTISPGKTGPFKIGCIAMLRPEKGLVDLLQAFAVLRNQGINVELSIAGEGPQRAELEGLIRKLKLEKTVKLLGYVDALSDYLNGLDLFVSASHIESFGLAIIETMRAAVPIVAAKSGEIPELLKDGRFGILIDRAAPNFIDRLAQTLQQALTKLPELARASHEGFLFHSVRLNPERLKQEYLDLYDKALRPGVVMVSPIVTQATGGIQKQLLLQSRELHRRGYKVFILQRKDPDLEKKKQAWEHVTFLQTPELNFLNHESNFFYRCNGALFVVMGFFRIFQFRRTIQIVHAHQLYSPTLVGFFSKLFLGKSLVTKVTASGDFGERNELQKLPFWRLRKFSFRFIDRVIVLSSQMKSEMQEIGFRREQIVLIPNSVATSNSTCTNFSDQAEKPFRILFTGRLSVEKSLDTLILASQILAREGLQCELSLVGGCHGGRDASAELNELASHREQNLRINFIGPVENIQDYYANADAFVLPSLSEGMSNALLEAMAAGIPCVVSDIPANLFVIEPEINGLSFQTRNPNDLARQLKRLRPVTIDQKIFRAKLSQEALKTVQERFSIRSVGQQLSTLYSSLTESDLKT